MANAKKKAVFLDRDGTINIDTGYVSKPGDFTFIEGAVESIRLFNKNGFLVIVITNQSGVGRGYYTEDDVDTLHKHINRQLALSGARIDAFYYCPHHPTGAKGKYRIDCNCRKPGIGLFKKAVKDFNIDVRSSYAIGDSMSDVKAAMKMKIPAIRVGSREPGKCYITAGSLPEAARFILGRKQAAPTKIS